MSESKFVKQEPIEQNAEMEFTETIKAEPYFSEYSESNPSFDDAPMALETCFNQEQNPVEVASYCSETIVKEELIIENSNESLIESLDEELMENGQSDSSTISGEKDLYCAECDKHFHIKHSYLGHRLRHQNLKNKKYQCEFCERPFSMKTELDRHVRVVHLDKNKRSQADNRTWKCHLCPVLSDTKESYRSHLQSHEQQVQGMSRCEFCSRCFVDEESLQSHVELGQCEKLPNHIVEDKNGLFRCGECNLAFTLRRTCLQHAKRHFALMNKTFQCKTCGSCHTTRSQLLKHERTHGETNVSKEDKPNLYRCSECPKTFLNRKDCDRHIKRHQSIKNGVFKCTECGKCYGRYTELRRHKEAHERKRGQDAAS